MLKPQLPENEAWRQQVLNALQLFDNGPDERFDRLTRMARRLFDVPIALVSLVDCDRQWFKSCIGLDTRETSRDVSFCGHTILGDTIFVIPDATLDVRFFDNPLVVGPPHIRFYAGCPLHVAHNARVGTLCIIDTKPRVMTPDDAVALRDLASMVESELAAQQAAITDPLTGLWNRRGFINAAQGCIDFCTSQDQPVTLVSIDLDDFKDINDRFGHLEGDAALRRLADCLTHSFRHSDTVARLGGDEFVVLMPAAGETDALLAIQRLQTRLAAIEDTLNLPYRTRFSSGCVVRDPRRDQDIAALLDRADAAMYRMKRRPPPTGQDASLPTPLRLPNWRQSRA